MPDRLPTYDIAFDLASQIVQHAELVHLENRLVTRNLATLDNHPWSADPLAKEDEKRRFLVSTLHRLLVSRDPLWLLMQCLSEESLREWLAELRGGDSADGAREGDQHLAQLVLSQLQFPVVRKSNNAYTLSKCQRKLYKARDEMALYYYIETDDLASVFGSKSVSMWSMLHNLLLSTLLFWQILFEKCDDLELHGAFDEELERSRHALGPCLIAIDNLEEFFKSGETPDQRNKRKRSIKGRMSENNRERDRDLAKLDRKGRNIAKEIENLLGGKQTKYDDLQELDRQRYGISVGLSDHSLNDSEGKVPRGHVILRDGETKRLKDAIEKIDKRLKAKREESLRISQEKDARKNQAYKAEKQIQQDDVNHETRRKAIAHGLQTWCMEAFGRKTPFSQLATKQIRQWVRRYRNLYAHADDEQLGPNEEPKVRESLRALQEVLDALWDHGVCPREIVILGTMHDIYGRGMILYAEERNKEQDPLWDPKRLGYMYFERQPENIELLSPYFLAAKKGERLYYEPAIAPCSEVAARFESLLRHCEPPGGDNVASQ